MPAELTALFHGSGFSPAAATAKLASVVPFGALVAQQDDGAPVVALFDGKILPSHAELLRLPRPPLLLACRENGQPSQWELRALAAWLAGAPLTALAPVPCSAWKIATVADLRAVSQDAEAAALEAGAGTAAGGIVADVMYELVANALFDAPHTASGTPKYAHQRGLEVQIEPGDACRATLAIADGRAYLTATDLFGRLTADPVASVVAGLGAKAQINSAGGGAGLGMRRLIEQSDLWAARVAPQVVTEVLCVVDLGDTRRRAGSPKSLMFTTLAGR